MDNDTKWQNLVRQHSNDAGYYRRCSSVLMSVAMEGMGEKELRRRLEEKFAPDIMGTVDSMVR